MKIEVQDADTAEEIIEQGIGLIARGLYRMSVNDGPDTAARAASTVLDHIRGHWMDLMRQASKEPISQDPATVLQVAAIISERDA